MTSTMFDIRTVATDLCDKGFSTVRIPERLHLEALELAQNFFALDAEAQMSSIATVSSGILGFYPSEDVIAKLRNRRDVAVLKNTRARGYSSFDFVNEETLGSSSILRKNVWPTDHFAAKALKIYSAVSAEAKMLSLALLADFEEKGWLSASNPGILTGPSCNLMRLLSYQCVREPIVSKAHTDYELLSFILSGESGLQVKAANGDWLDATCKAPFAIVLAGDMIEALTSGRIQSPLHRVRLERGTRISVVFFQGLALRTKLSYSRYGIDCPKTFGAHILPLLARGAAHLGPHLDDIGKDLGCDVPISNFFKVGK